MCLCRSPCSFLALAAVHDDALGGALLVGIIIANYHKLRLGERMAAGVTHLLELVFDLLPFCQACIDTVIHVVVEEKAVAIPLYIHLRNCFWIFVSQLLPECGGQVEDAILKHMVAVPFGQEILAEDIFCYLV